MTPHVIWTLRAIARRLGVAEEETVIAYAMRPRDPLRVRFLLGKHWIKTARLDAWKARQQEGNACERLRGLPAIAARLGVSINTAKAYARRQVDPLPVVGLGTRAPWIYVDAVADWLDAQDRPAVSVRMMGSDTGRGKGRARSATISVALTHGERAHSDHDRDVEPAEPPLP